MRCVEQVRESLLHFVCVYELIARCFLRTKTANEMFTPPTHLQKKEVLSQRPMHFRSAETPRVGAGPGQRNAAGPGTGPRRRRALLRPAPRAGGTSGPLG